MLLRPFALAVSFLLGHGPATELSSIWRRFVGRIQKVTLLVWVDCDGCERRRVRKELESRTRVSSMDAVDPSECRVTVSGHVEAPEVVKRLRRRAGKKAEPWPFVPRPYDHKAPPGYVVRDDPEKAPLVRASSMEER
ncbi:hypothetical protein PR202_gb18637 [Eleusine coracana subsp. coracana]|uniref:HMA domain-containing protein n=1 Tax=Eleusine coracana subsp. coracana TaxID=191504 RepID=A0AAV5F657_ELECO|nr:hypothetical protein PR202_gb18637 [Eleusine coracana subsp. coracana]